MNPCDELIPLAKRLDDGTVPAQRNLTVPEEKAIDAALFSGSKLVGERNLGWKCPTCGRGHSPFTTTCPCIPLPFTAIY
jgi:hypothetical protein